MHHAAVLGRPPAFQLHCAHGNAAQVPAEQQYMKLKPRPPRRERTNSPQRKQKQTIADKNNIVRNKQVYVLDLTQTFTLKN